MTRCGLFVLIAATACQAAPALQPMAAGSGEVVGVAAVSGTCPEPDPSGFDGPCLLSQTGLFTNTRAGTLAPGVVAYEPLGQLWADGADKRRWVLLPEGSVIESSNMDAWVYPVGTKIWKEFSLAGQRLETRLIEKLPDASWRMVAYAWFPDLSDAQAAPRGEINAAGTSHDIPDMDACKQCHEGRPDRVLGFSALQLAHAGTGMTLERLSAGGKLSAAPAQPIQLPGDTTDQTALAYLHANCGHCHNPQRKRAEREISVYFWQEAKALTSVHDSVTYSSLVATKSQPLWLDAVLARMQDRGGLQQMPPLATKDVDAAGLTAVSTWLSRLRADFPPSPAPPPASPQARCEGVEKIFAIFERAACRSAFCHGSGTGELDFSTPEQLHASMVSVRAVGEGCKDLPLARVQPGDPEHSLLLLKLRPGPPCGKIMPPAASQALTPADIQVVSDWIAACSR